MDAKKEEKSVNQFTTFFKYYVPYHYRALPREVTAAFGALFGRQNPLGWNRWLVFDHGLLWKLLRDLAILISTAIRVTVGVVVLVTAPPLIIVLALLRAVYIPLRGLWLSSKVALSFWRVNRARNRRATEPS